MACSGTALAFRILVTLNKVNVHTGTTNKLLLETQVLAQCNSLCPVFSCEQKAVVVTLLCIHAC
jgi:hypothetical protein